MSILKTQSSEERNRLFQVEEMACPKAQKEKRARRVPKKKKSQFGYRCQREKAGRQISGRSCPVTKSRFMPRAVGSHGRF